MLDYMRLQHQRQQSGFARYGCILPLHTLVGTQELANVASHPWHVWNYRDVLVRRWWNRTPIFRVVCRGDVLYVRLVGRRRRYTSSESQHFRRVSLR